MSQDFEDIRALVEGKISTDWTTTPIDYENVPESPALRVAKEGGSPWIRVTIRNGTGALISMADTKVYRTPALVIISVFTAQKTGTRLNHQYNSALADIWRGYFIPNVSFKTPSEETTGESGQWFQINLSIPFHWDNII